MGACATFCLLLKSEIIDMFIEFPLPLAFPLVISLFLFCCNNCVCVRLFFVLFLSRLCVRVVNDIAGWTTSSVLFRTYSPPKNRVYLSRWASNIWQIIVSLKSWDRGVSKTGLRYKIGGILRQLESTLSSDVFQKGTLIVVHPVNVKCLTSKQSESKGAISHNIAPNT